MASRTYSALGAGWATWIDLDGSGKAGIVLTRESGPHAFVKDAAQAQDVFNVVRGPAIDNMPGAGGENTRAFTQEFPQTELARIKVVSEQAYAAQFEAAAKRAEEAETEEIDDVPAAPTATAKKASKRSARKTATA